MDVNQRVEVGRNARNYMSNTLREVASGTGGYGDIYHILRVTADAIRPESQSSPEGPALSFVAYCHAIQGAMNDRKLRHNPPRNRWGFEGETFDTILIESYVAARMLGEEVGERFPNRSAGGVDFEDVAPLNKIDTAIDSGMLREKVGKYELQERRRLEALRYQSSNRTQGSILTPP